MFLLYRTEQGTTVPNSSNGTSVWVDGSSTSYSTILSTGSLSFSTANAVTSGNFNLNTNNSILLFNPSSQYSLNGSILTVSIPSLPAVYSAQSGTLIYCRIGIPMTNPKISFSSVSLQFS